MQEKYSALIGLEKTLFRMLIIGGPVLIGALPEDWMNMTIGGVIMFLINYAKNKNLGIDVEQ